MYELTPPPTHTLTTSNPQHLSVATLQHKSDSEMNSRRSLRTVFEYLRKGWKTCSIWFHGISNFQGNLMPKKNSSNTNQPIAKAYRFIYIPKVLVRSWTWKLLRCFSPGCYLLRHWNPLFVKQEIRGKINTNQTTALLQSAKIIGKVLEGWRRLAFTQTSVKNYELKNIRKTR